MTKYIHTEQEINYSAGAELISSYLIDLFNPKSVIDVGCGYGKWLKSFSDKGIEDIFGADGAYIDKSKLLIPTGNFYDVDLEKPLKIDRTFELLLCLEVAEHLTSKRADSLVFDLVQLSNVIVFSAAIPFQGGQGHINEHLPQYWVELFEKNGYSCYDIVRPTFWNNREVEWWYRQNILIFINRNYPVNLVATKVIKPLISEELYECYLRRINQLERKIINFKTIKRYIKNTLMFNVK